MSTPEDNSPPAEPRLPSEGAGRAPVKYRKVNLSFARRTAAVEMLRARWECIQESRLDLAEIAQLLSERCGFAVSPNSVPGLCEAAGEQYRKYPTRRTQRAAPAPQAQQPAPPDACAPFVVWA